MRYREWIATVAGTVPGVIFIASGLGKLLGQNTLLANILSLPLVNPALATVIARGLPWVELILGILLVTEICTRFAAALSGGLIAAFIFYNSWMIAHGLGTEDCGCFGILEKVLQGELTTTDSLYIDIGLLVLVLATCFSYSGSFFNTRPWFLREKVHTE